ncbi:hypothetical protein ACTXG5_06665 [Mycobacterium sp. Dal123C01]|uniref:hypothetical protein n=1 Tax=Mycobacterium sp. Dal123C01 TaxID=3457577 RepID=UPI00403ED5DD
MASEEEPPKGGEPADDKSEPETPSEAEQPEDGEDEYSAGGSIEFQDAATTKPRPPTPAELRARDKYAKKQKELEEARLEAEAKRRHQRRVLMGAAAAVGVVGVVAALGYWALSTPNVTAQCVQEDPSGQPVIVPDGYCTGHTEGLNGFYYFGGHQYHYYYGSSGSVGSRPSGGTTSAPKGANITTKSGTSISRGGLGGSSSGKGSGS